MMVFLPRIVLALVLTAIPRHVMGVDICPSRTITSLEGEITTPNYPSNYPRNKDCRLTITPDAPDATVVIKFDDFSLEEDDDDPDQCLYDSLLIIEGGEVNKRLCGLDRFIRDYISTTNSVVLHFTSSDSDEYKGFRLTYTTTIPVQGDNICPGLRIKSSDSSSSGSVYSPNYPKPYPNDKNCVALIDVPENHLAHVWFTRFAVQESPTCRFDKLEVRDRVGGATICGKEEGEVPPVMLMKGKQIHIEFTSDAEIQENGFLLHYNFTRIQRGQCICTVRPFYVKVTDFMPKIVRETDDIQFEFKTKQSTGVMMYIKGFHRDYIHVGLRRGNVIYCHIDLGTGVGRVEFVSPRVSDDQWHQVHISREDRNITLRFDGVIVGQGRTRGAYNRLDIPHSLAYFLGGPGDHRRRLPFFTGCIRHLSVDGVEPLAGAVVGKQDFHVSDEGAYEEC